MKDEILAKALSTDTEIVPRYDIVKPDGTKVAENAQLVLKNAVTQEGTALNKATLLTDETAAALGLGDNPTVDEALGVLKKDVDNVEKVGDIKTTVRTDLGDDWLLCNGEAVNTEEYPGLKDWLPQVLNNITYETPNTGFSEGDYTWPGTALLQSVFVENGRRIALVGEKVGTNIYDWYAYHNIIGTQEWIKSNSVMFTNLASWGWTYPSFSYANGYYYVSNGAESVRIKTGATSGVIKAKKSADLLTWEDASITMNIQGGAYSEQYFILGKIIYNATAQRYCIGLIDTSSTPPTSFRLELGEATGNGDIVITTGTMQSGGGYYDGGAYGRFWSSLISVGNYCAMCGPGTSWLRYVDASGMLPATLSVASLDSTAGASGYTNIPALIDGRLVYFTSTGVFLIQLESNSATVVANSKLATSCVYLKNSYLDVAKKALYISRGNTLYKYVYDNLETDTAFAQTQSVSFPSNTITTGEQSQCLCGDGAMYAEYNNTLKLRFYAPLEVYSLPAITTEGAYNYIKGR